MRSLSVFLCATAVAAGPCDIFGSSGTPCVAAHSMVRALYAGYAGRLYQVTRLRDNATLDISTLSPGGFANATAQIEFCAQPSSVEGVPPLNTTVNLVPVIQPGLSFRHCDAQGFITPTDANPDHDFVLVAALNGAPAPAISFQSVNFPTWFIAPIVGAEPGRVGLVQAPLPDDASWLPTQRTNGSVTLTLLAPSRASAPLLVPGQNITGSCAGNYAPPSASVYLSPVGSSGASWVLAPLPGPPTCAVTAIYDQSPRGNHLTPAPAGGAVPRPDKPVDAGRLPITASGFPVFGAYFEGGQGYRIDNTSGVATGNDPETIYMVTAGSHFNNGCCFDYGNAETNDHDDGAGTMECVYFGTWNATASGWCGGVGPGPWVMADLEDGLWACGEPSSRLPTAVTQTAPFVTGMVKGGSAVFGLKGGDATDAGGLATLYSGNRPPGYQPMKKQGALILGIGGDNSDSAVGSFFEGAVTAGLSTDAADAAVQADIAQVGYRM